MVSAQEKHYSSSSKNFNLFFEFLRAYEILQCWVLHSLLEAMSYENENILNVMKLFCIISYNEIEDIVALSFVNIIYPLFRPVNPFSRLLIPLWSFF